MDTGDFAFVLLLNSGGRDQRESPDSGEPEIKGLETRLPTRRLSSFHRSSFLIPLTLSPLHYIGFFTSIPV